MNCLLNDNIYSQNKDMLSLAVNELFRKYWDYECSSVVVHLPSTCKAGRLILSTEKRSGGGRQKEEEEEEDNGT